VFRDKEHKLHKTLRNITGLGKKCKLLNITGLQKRRLIP